MQTYASQKATLDANNSPQQDNSSDIETLKKAIKDIEEELDKLCADK